MLAYFAEAVADNLVAGQPAYLPLTDVAVGGPPLWPPAIALPLLALGVTAYTRGASRWAHQLSHNG